MIGPCNTQARSQTLLPFRGNGNKKREGKKKDHVNEVAQDFGQEAKTQQGDQLASNNIWGCKGELRKLSLDVSRCCYVFQIHFSRVVECPAKNILYSIDKYCAWNQSQFVQTERARWYRYSLSGRKGIWGLPSRAWGDLSNFCHEVAFRIGIDFLNINVTAVIPFKNFKDACKIG